MASPLRLTIVMDARERRELKSEFGEDKVTIDHGTIRRWIESRCGRPAVVRRSHRRTDWEMLRIAFPGQEDESLREISWSEFFDAFERCRLAFLYQDAVEDAVESRYYQFVDRGAFDGRHA